MNTTTKPGVLESIDAAIEWAREVSDQHIDGEDGLRQQYAADLRNAREARATVERLADSLTAADFDACKVDALLAKSNKLDAEKLMGRMAIKHWPTIRAALAAFRGEGA